MLKWIALLAALYATPALAQPAPGPGPAPNPWVVIGSAVTYGGCVDVPSTVTGGCKGNGTLNATAIYQAGVQVLSTLPNGQIYVGNASGLPIAQTPSGDLSMTNAGVFTIGNNAVSNAKIAQAAAATLKGNPTAALANVQDFTISGLTNQPTPDPSLDFLLVWDHTAGTFKKVNPAALSSAASGITALTGDVTAAGPGSVAATLVTAQPGAHTWAATQTFTVAPVFTDQSGSRTALGLGSAAVQNIGTSGATVPLLSGANTWGAVQTLPSPAFTGTVSGANTVPLGVIAQSGANTMLGNWTGATANVVAEAMPSCPDSGGSHLNYVSGTGITCGTGPGFGNPTATIGLTAKNGTATTAMRSDAAPALDQSIAPTWTGQHTFSLVPIWPSQTAHLIWAAPSGASGAPTFRALVGSDLPNPSASSLGGVESYVAVSHQWINAISTSGVPSSSQPAASDLSNGTTGSGAVVLASGGVLTLGSATGLPISTGVSGLGTGIATFLATPSFSNLSAAVTGGTVTQTIASGASAMGTSAIASGACATTVTATAVGTLTTDAVYAVFNGDPTGVTGYVPSTSGMLTILIWPSAGNVNFKVCNNTASSITPGAVTINWRVAR